MLLSTALKCLINMGFVCYNWFGEFMTESGSKFPKFFIYMFSALIVVMIILSFFSALAVGNTYFVMLLVVIVFMLLDRHYGFFITNYKPIFIMFDTAGLVAVLTILLYEISKHSVTLIVFLSILIALSVALIITDALLVQKKYISKRECLGIDFIQLCSMICILTYFYKVSSFWYAVVASVFSLINLAMKIYVAIKLKNREVEAVEEQLSTENKTIMQIERDSGEGDIE